MIFLSFLVEACADDRDDAVLLLRRHFVVGWEAEAAGEDVGADVEREAVGAGAALDVGVAPCAARAVARDEGMRAVDGLHVHGLPDGTALRVDAADGVEDLRRAGFAVLRAVEGLLLATDMRAHGVRVDDEAAEPKVRLAVCRVVGVHLDRESFESLAVALVDRLFLGDVLLEVRDLAADDAGDDVRHAVVVADFLMLVPRGRLAGLGAPFADLFRVLLAVREEHAARAARDDLVAVEADAVPAAKRTGLLAFVRGAEGLRRVLEDHGAVALTDGAELVDLARRAVEVRDDDDLDLRIEREGFFEGHRVHVPRVGLRVDEDGLAVLVGDRVDRRVKRHVRAEHAMPLHSALADPWLAVEVLARQFHGEMQGRCTSGKADRIPAAHLLCDRRLHGVDVRPHRRHPVRLIGLGHILQLRAMHRRTAEPDLLWEWIERLRIEIKHNNKFLLQYCSYYYSTNP